MQIPTQTLRGGKPPCMSVLVPYCTCWTARRLHVHDNNVSQPASRPAWMGPATPQSASYMLYLGSLCRQHCCFVAPCFVCALTQASSLENRIACLSPLRILKSFVRTALDGRDYLESNYASSPIVGIRLRHVQLEESCPKKSLYTGLYHPVIHCLKVSTLSKFLSHTIGQATSAPKSRLATRRLGGRPELNVK